MNLYEEMGYAKNANLAPGSTVSEFDITIKPGDSDYELVKSDPEKYANNLLKYKKASLKPSKNLDLFEDMYGSYASKLAVPSVIPEQKEFLKVLLNQLVKLH